MNKPLVSVVMTVFKRTEYLEEAIKSVLNQTFKDFELIITDDANTEAARAISQRFSYDTRVRYRSNPTILGAPLNMAAALKEAQGEFVTLFNDDDLMEPDMLESLLPPLQSDPQCIVSFGDHWAMNCSGEILPELSKKRSHDSGTANLPVGEIKTPFSLTVRAAASFVMGTMFRKSTYCEDWLPVEVAGAYDCWLAMRFSLAEGRFYFTPKCVMRWRIHPNSESARRDSEKAICSVYIFKSLLLLKIPDDER